MSRGARHGRAKMAKYLDPKADLTFKKVFGEHEDLVASLLNALLPLPPDARIEGIEYLPTEVVPDDPLHKDSIVDVRCRDSLGRQFVVEMQMIWAPDFNQRALFNASKAYSRQLPAGGDYAELKPVYSLNLLNDVMNPDVPECYHHYALTHRKYRDRTIDGIQLVFVELPKFRPQSMAERKMAVLWLRFLTEINEETRRAPPELAENPEVGKALEIVEEAGMTDEERARYDGFVDWLRRERGRARREKELGDVEARLGEANAKLKVVTERLDAATAKLDAATAKLDAATAERDAATAERDAATAKLDAATAERDAAVEKLRQTARSLLAMGLPASQIAAATGMDVAAIGALKGS